MTIPPAQETPSLLEAVRDGCRAVADDATLVRVDRARLLAFADELAAELDGRDAGSTSPRAVEVADPWAVTVGDSARDNADADSDADADPNGDLDATESAVALVLALDTVNFGSGYHPHVHKRSGASGAVTMASGLRDWVDAAGPITAAGLRSLAVADAHEIFGQPDGDEALSELMTLFATALNDLGSLVEERFSGRFTELVDEADHSANALVMILRELPFFRDECRYRDRVVPFYKRAQLAAADLGRAFAGVGPGRFGDLDRLTAFADNLVPHVLRVEGVLDYERALAAVIDSGQLIESGDPAEVEIRAGGVHAVELLRHELAGRGIDVLSSELESVLWKRGGAPAYKAIPRHRTRSVFY